MKRRLYTASFAGQVGDGRFTAVEHERASRQGTYDVSDAVDAVCRYLETEAAKLEALELLGAHLAADGFDSVVSLGAGEGVLEHLLATQLPEVAVAATDLTRSMSSALGVCSRS